MLRENTVLIDWLSVTSKIHSPYDMMELVGMPDPNTWQEIKGARGYKYRFWRDSISIHYGGGEDMGVWLEMSGQGCRAFETFSDGNYDRIFQAVIDNPGEMKLTRLDVAFDEYTHILDIDRICDDTRQQKYRTLKLYPEQQKFWEVIESSNGKTAQVGSPSSMVLVRIYDKLAERKAKIKDAGEQDKLLGDIDHWMRVELQLRDDRAMEFVRYLLPDANPVIDTGSTLTLGQAYVGTLRKYLDYGYATKARGHPDQEVWHTYPYWQTLLGTADKLSIYRKPGIDYNLQRATNYVANMAGNAIDALLKIYGVEEFQKIIENRNIKQNPKYRNLINSNGIYRDEAKEEDVHVDKPKTDADITAVLALLNEHAEQSSEALRARYENLIQRMELLKTPLIDTHGKRYVYCRTCRRIYLSSDMRLYGGAVNPNSGICKNCF